MDVECMANVKYLLQRVFGSCKTHAPQKKPGPITHTHYHDSYNYDLYSLIIASDFCVADVDPAVLQRLLLVDLLLRCRRFPGGENIGGNQVR